MIRGVDREGAVFSPNTISHWCQVGWFPVVGPYRPLHFSAPSPFSGRQYSITSYYVNLNSGSQLEAGLRFVACCAAQRVLKRSNQGDKRAPN